MYYVCVVSQCQVLGLVNVSHQVYPFLSSGFSCLSSVVFSFLLAVSCSSTGLSCLLVIRFILFVISCVQFLVRSINLFVNRFFLFVIRFILYVST